MGFVPPLARVIGVPAMKQVAPASMVGVMQRCAVGSHVCPKLAQSMVQLGTQLVELCVQATQPVPPRLSQVFPTLQTPQDAE
jgi:hypothetical protein